MTEESPSTIGSVAQEAARLIEDMATMARSSYSRSDAPDPCDGEPAWEPDAPPAARHTQDGEPATPGTEHSKAEHPTAERSESEPSESERSESVRPGPEGSPDGRPRAGRSGDEPQEGPCSMCGGEGDTQGRDTPSTCKICPLCRGIALMRSVRPETVDLLADLALSLAATLRDVATKSRASDPGSYPRSASGGPSDSDRDSVQDIHVDDESEGGRR